MATPTTQGRTPPQSGRIAQQAPAGTVVLPILEDGAFPQIAFTGQVAVNLSQKALAYYDTDGVWQSVISGSEVRSYYGEVAPTGVGMAGDRWFNSKSLMWYSWNPTYAAWMPGDIAYGESAPTNPTVGEAWFNPQTRALTYFNGTTWVSGSDPTAPGVYSGAMPAAATAGSAWTDTDGIAWACDTTYTGGTGTGKWSRWALRVDPLAKLILANRTAVSLGESSASPPLPAMLWSAYTLGMVWLDTQPGSPNLGNFYVWDGTSWRRVYAPNTIDLCLSLIATQSNVQFINTDSLTLTAPGPATLHLSYVPAPGSLHVYWNGLEQAVTEWTRTGHYLTIPDLEGYLRAGDTITAVYAYYPGATTNIAPAYVSTSWAQAASIPVPAPKAGTTGLGDLLVLVLAGGTGCTDSRMTLKGELHDSSFGITGAIYVGIDDGSGSPLALTSAVLGGVMRVSGDPMLPATSEALTEQTSSVGTATFTPTVAGSGSFGVMAIASTTGLVPSTISGDALGNWTYVNIQSSASSGHWSFFLGYRPGGPAAGQWNQPGSNPGFLGWMGGIQ